MFMRSAGILVAAAFSLCVCSVVGAEVPLLDLDESELGEIVVADPQRGAIARDHGIRVEGESALRFEFLEGSPVIWRIAEPVPIEPRVLYQLSADIRCFLLGSAGVRMFAEWLDADGNPIHVESDFWGTKFHENRTPWIGATAGWRAERLVVRAPDGAATVRFGCRLESVRPGRERRTRRVAWVDALAWGPTVEFSLEGDAIGNVFQEEAVGFEVKAGDPMPVHVDLELYDFWGDRLERHEWSPAGPGSDHRLELGRLDPGYYELRWDLDAGPGALSRTGTTSLCVLGALDAEPIRPSAICVDGALSWFYRGEELRQACEICRSMGIQLIRDRLNWSQVEKRRGEFDFSLIETSTNMQNDAGMAVYQDFSDTPGWSIPGRVGNTSLPDDPMDVFRVMENLARHFRGRIDYWEIWNEPYHPEHFRGRPDEYVSYLKAAYLGCKAGNPDSVVLTCSFNTMPVPWSRRVIENGALEYADVYNFHSYAKREHISEYLALHKEQMIDYGLRLPMWLTEDGCKSRRNVQGNRLAGDRIAARFAAEHAVVGLAEGVDRFFYFAFPEMWEGAEGPWGIVREDLTPKPVLVAIANARRLLGRAESLGTVELQPAGIPGHVFGRGDGTAVVVALPEKQRHIHVPGAGPHSRAMDIMGNDKALPFVVTKEGLLSVETGVFPLFVTNIDASALSIEPPGNPWPRFDRRAMRDPGRKQLWIEVKVRGLESEASDGQIIGDLRQAVWTSPDGTPLPVTVVAYNCSDRDATLTLGCTMSAVLEVTGLADASLAVPAHGSASCEGTVTLVKPAADEEYRIRFEGEAEGFGVTPVVVYFRQAPGIR